MGVSVKDKRMTNISLMVMTLTARFERLKGKFENCGYYYHHTNEYHTQVKKFGFKLESVLSHLFLLDPVEACHWVIWLRQEVGIDLQKFQSIAGMALGDKIRKHIAEHGPIKTDWQDFASRNGLELS